MGYVRSGEKKVSERDYELLVECDGKLRCGFGCNTSFGPASTSSLRKHYAKHHGGGYTLKDSGSRMLYGRKGQNYCSRHVPTCAGDCGKTLCPDQDLHPKCRSVRSLWKTEEAQQSETEPVTADQRSAPHRQLHKPNHWRYIPLLCRRT